MDSAIQLLNNWGQVICQNTRTKIYILTDSTDSTLLRVTKQLLNLRKVTFLYQYSLIYLFIQIKFVQNIFTLVENDFAVVKMILP